MKIRDFICEQTQEQTKETFVSMFEKFLPVAMQVLDLDSLPKMKFLPDIKTNGQPSFGMYSTGNRHLYIALANRHPIDILRTIAHELTHYSQDLNDELEDNSGDTGSPHENQANLKAGIIMRLFNKKYPEYLKTRPIIT